MGGTEDGFAISVAMKNTEKLVKHINENWYAYISRKYISVFISIS